MKKLILGLAIAGLLASCASDSYKITGKFEGDASGKVFLRKLDATGIVPVDTTEITEGSFEFTGKADVAQVYLVYLDGNRNPIVLFVENEKITITANPEKMEEAVIEGSKLSDIYAKFMNEIPHKEQSGKMEQEFYKAQASGDAEAIQSLMADMEKIREDQRTYAIGYVKENSENVVGAFMALNMIGEFSAEELDSIATNLNKSLPLHPYVVTFNEQVKAVKMQKEIEAAFEVGKVAPSFKLKDINGKDVSLDDFKGKYVMIDFWAGWCAPCRAENPELKKVYEKFGGKDFEIISISLDKTEDDWKKAVKEDGLNWTLLFDANGVTAELYGIQNIPSTWLLNREGVIVNKQFRSNELMEILEAGLLTK
jgi:peroxiredoxin